MMLEQVRLVWAVERLVFGGREEEMSMRIAVKAGFEASAAAEVWT